MAHQSEPSLEQLREIRRALYKEKSTDGNVKRINAVEAQIKRLEAESAASENTEN